jgi:serine/threonine-protein kinase
MTAENAEIRGRWTQLDRGPTDVVRMQREIEARAIETWDSGSYGESSSAAASFPIPSIVDVATSWRARLAPTPRVSALPRAARLAVGDAVANTGYRIVAPFARGGMGALYEVEHATLPRRALLKVVSEPMRFDASVAERSVEEARLLEELRGAPVPVVHDAGVLEDGRPFFVMELLRGSDLKRELARLGALSVPSALRITAGLLDALTAVHERGVVHADIKADNVFCTDERLVMLLDFGAARRSGVAPRSGEPRVGTPRSMAPEQFDEAALDARTDTYAVGLLLYELVVGEGPFEGRAESHDDFRRAHARLPPPAPSTRALQVVPSAIDGVVLRALAKRPGDRYASAAEMLEDLSAAARRRIDGDETVDAWSGY